MTSGNQIRFVIAGDGIALPRLKALCRSKRITNVIFLPRRSAEEMPSLYALADLLLVHLKDTPLFRITIPHKILTYLGTGKPILAAITGDAATVISQSGAGTVCPSENPAVLAEAVRTYSRMTTAERNTIGARGPLAVAASFDRAKIVDRIERILRRET